MFYIPSLKTGLIFYIPSSLRTGLTFNIPS